MKAATLAIPARLGAVLLSIAEQVGGLAVMSGQILRRLVPPRLDYVEFIRNMYRMGVKSVAIVTATAFFTGGIMVIQAAPIVQSFNAKHFVGWAAMFTTFREIGPLLIALMFNGRVGANNTAELGTMVVTEQVDALRALAIDPIAYLIVPRVLSMIIMMTALVILGDALAIIGAVLTADLMLDFHPRSFLAYGLPMIGVWDFMIGIIKASIYGTMIGISSCYFGLATSGGAPGVGLAVNRSVVASASSVFIVDYFSNFVLG